MRNLLTTLTLLPCPLRPTPSPPRPPPSRPPAVLARADPHPARARRHPPRPRHRPLRRLQPLRPPRTSSLVADDVEFYHDQGGLTLGNAALTESIRKNICGHVTRQLTPGTLKVYPMKGLGAIEIGTHRFFENGSPTASGVAEFTMLWLYKDGAWKISRVLSYDHHAAK